MCSREVFFYPICSIYKVDCIGIMFLYTGCNSKYIWVKNYIVRIKAHLIHKKSVCPFTNINLSLVSISLSLLIESHNNDCCSHALYKFSMFNELLLSLV